MSALLHETPEAEAWSEQMMSDRKNSHAFGNIATAVVWADILDSNGKLLVEADPSHLVDEINSHGLPLLRGHDPGCPSGKVFAAKQFKTSGGTRFVAAMLGLYENEKQLRFSSLGINTNPPVTSPQILGALNNNCWLKISTDPREVDPEWIDDILRDAPVKVIKSGLSHNASEAITELIRISLPYVAIVWNPYVTAISSEAGKDTYAAIRRWINNIFTKLAERKDPIISLDSYQDGCSVSFLFRGKNVQQHYAAHDALPKAAAQAATLISNMKYGDLVPASLVYEFDPDASLWFPKFSILEDGRLVSDHNVLIAIEQMPKGLSLGLELREELEDGRFT